MPTADEEERDALEKMFGGPYSAKYWSGQNVWELVKAIEHLWTTEQSHVELWQHFKIAYRHSNQVLHATAHALEQSMGTDQGDSFSFHYGPSKRNIGQALASAHWTYGQTLSLVFDHFQLPDRSRFDEPYRLGNSLLRNLTDEEFESAGRNDPCPCDSGRKFKRCHDALPAGAARVQR